MTAPLAILNLFDAAATETREAARVSKYHSVLTPSGYESAALEINHGYGTTFYVAQFTAKIDNRAYEQAAHGASIAEAVDNLRAKFVAWWESGA